jgi:hypothetical protein
VQCDTDDGCSRNLCKEEIIWKASQRICKWISRYFISIEISSTSTGKQISKRLFVKEVRANTACSFGRNIRLYWNTSRRIPQKYLLPEYRFVTGFAKHCVMCSRSSANLFYRWDYSNSHVYTQIDTGRHISAYNTKLTHKILLYDIKVEILCSVSVRRIIGPIFFSNTDSWERHIEQILASFLKF